MILALVLVRVAAVFANGKTLFLCLAPVPTVLEFVSTAPAARMDHLPRLIFAIPRSTRASAARTPTSVALWRVAAGTASDTLLTQMARPSLVTCTSAAARRTFARLARHQTKIRHTAAPVVPACASAITPLLLTGAIGQSKSARTAASVTSPAVGLPAAVPILSVRRASAVLLIDRVRRGRIA